MTFVGLRWLFERAYARGVLIRLTYRGMSLTHALAHPENIPWSFLKSHTLADVLDEILDYADRANKLTEKVKHF